MSSDGARLIEEFIRRDPTQWHMFQPIFGRREPADRKGVRVLDPGGEAGVGRMAGALSRGRENGAATRDRRGGRHPLEERGEAGLENARGVESWVP